MFTKAVSMAFFLPGVSDIAARQKSAWLKTPDGQDVVIDGVGIPGVPMHTTWHYKTSTPSCDGVSGSDGIASCTRNISSATSGYYVSITVEFTYEGQSYYAYTGFTPE